MTRISFILVLVVATLSRVQAVPDTPPLKKIVIDSSTNHILDTHYRRIPLPGSLESSQYAQLRERVNGIVNLSGMDEIQVLMTLTAWVSNQWKHDGRSVPAPNLTACQLLDKVKKGARFNCEGYAKVLCDVLLSQGTVARVVQLRTKDQSYGEPGQGHIAVEAWSNMLKKWIFLDPQLNGLILRENQPLSVLEASVAIQEGQSSNLQFICTGLSAEQYRAFLIRHFGFLVAQIKTGSHDALLALSLGGTEQFLTFQGLPASGTEFTTHSEDFYPVVNETSMSFYFDEQLGYNEVMKQFKVHTKEDYVRSMPLFAPKPQFKVGLQNNMPWFDHYEVSIDNSRWSIIRGAELSWSLHEGSNTIRVRSVNTRQMAGIVTEMHITYGNQSVTPGASH